MESMDAKSTKMKRSQRKRISPDQLEYMVTFMETNPNLKNGVLTPNFTKEDRRKKWEELSVSLNALVGSVKNPSLWKKAWNDQKSYVRTKAARLKRKCPEEETSISEMLSPMEERILNLVGWGQTFWESKAEENKEHAEDSVTLPPSNTEPLFSDEDSEASEEAIDREPIYSEEEAEFNEKKKANATIKIITVPNSDCSKKPPPKKPKLTLCGMTAATLAELRHQGLLLARNVAIQEETLSALQVISSSLQSISTNLEKIADVAVNRI